MVVYIYLFASLGEVVSKWLLRRKKRLSDAFSTRVAGTRLGRLVEWL
jgi:hypothetical protein